MEFAGASQNSKGEILTTIKLSVNLPSAYSTLILNEFHVSLRNKLLLKMVSVEVILEN